MPKDIGHAHRTQGHAAWAGTGAHELGLGDLAQNLWLQGMPRSVKREGGSLPKGWDRGCAPQMDPGESIGQTNHSKLLSMSRPHAESTGQADHGKLLGTMPRSK